MTEILLIVTLSINSIKPAETQPLDWIPVLSLTGYVMVSAMSESVRQSKLYWVLIDTVVDIIDVSRGATEVAANLSIILGSWPKIIKLLFNLNLAGHGISTALNN